MGKGGLLNVLAGLALCLQCSAQDNSGGPAKPTAAPTPAPAPNDGVKKHKGNSHTTHKKQHGTRFHEPNVPYAPLVMQDGNDDRELAFILAAIGTVPYGHHVRYHITEPKSHKVSGCGDLTNMFEKASGTNALTLLLLDGDKDDCSMVRRAYNAGHAGAAGVLISRSGAEKSSFIEARVDASVDDLPSIEGIQIPVGTMIPAHAKILRELFHKEQDKGTKHMLVKVDFTHLIPREQEARVWIWHDTADDCGSLCDANVAFLKEVAASQVKHAAKSKVHVRPRFIFQPCGDKGTPEECAKTCTANGKYCHLKDEYVAEKGAAVAYEMVREACLWRVLTDSNDKLSSPEWWQYKQQFLEQCTSAAGKYNQECSVGVAQGILSGDQLNAWRECFEPAADASKTVDVAENEMKAMNKETVVWYDKLLVQINQVHYHGLFDEGHVYHAACTGMKNHGSDPICQTEAHGPCAPGRNDDIRCRNNQAHLTVCKALPGDGHKGFCKCAAGFKNKGKSEPDQDDQECVDDNECTHKTDPCHGQKGNPLNERRVCHNLRGRSECLLVADACTEEQDYGGCFRIEHQGGIASACVDQIEEVREQAGADEPVPANQLPAYSVCDCDRVGFGCWKTDGQTCTERCDEGRCNEETGECAADPEKRTAGIVGGVVAALVVAVAALVVFVVRKRHLRSKDRADLHKQASAYAAWQDGLSGDEMQRSATVASSNFDGNTRGDGAFRAASAANYVSGTGEEVLPDA